MALLRQSRAHASGLTATHTLDTDPSGPMRSGRLPTPKSILKPPTIRQQPDQPQVTHGLTFTFISSMPTYFARGVTVRLGAQPLAETITPKIVLKKGEIAKTQCEKAEKQLLGSELLHERRVNFPNDEAGFELNWLGGAPFMQVQTGKDLYEESRDESWPGTVNPSHIRHSASTNNSHPTQIRSKDNALALSLHVKLSDKTFISGLDTSNRLHLKIDVFFNGKLSSCLFIPTHDVRSKTKQYHQVFGGHRVDYLAERPWVIISPHKDDSSGPWLPVAKRWDEIRRALRREADERGKDQNGNIPPTAEFLKALATMQMPSEVQSMQKSNKKTFGVIDVVITAGEGRKLTSGLSYLKAPQRLIDESYPIIPDGDKRELDSEKDVSAEALAPPVMAARHPADLDADGESDSECERPTKRRALAGPQVVSMLRKPEAESSVLSSNRFHSARMPSSSPVKTHNLPSGMSSALEYQTAVRGSASSSECGQAHQSRSTGFKKPYMPNGPSYGTPPSLHSFPSSSVGHAHTPNIQPSPYDYRRYSHPLGIDSPSTPVGFAFSGNGTSWSSPLPQSHGNVSPMPLSQVPHVPGSMYDARGFAAMGASSSLPELSRRGSMSSFTDSRFSPAAPWGYPFQSQSTMPFQGLQYSSTVSTRFSAPLPFDRYDEQSLGCLPLLSSPYDRRLSMPLPPMGMFSVPTKPKLSWSSTKSSRSLSPMKQGGNLLIRRLVITGSNGVVVVDHRWSTAQPIVSGRDFNTSHSSDTSPLCSLNSSMFSATRLCSSNTKQSSSKTTVHADAPRPTSQSQNLRSTSVASRNANTRLCAPGVQNREATSYSSDLSSPPSLDEDRRDSMLDVSGTFTLPLKGVEKPRAATSSAMPQRRVSTNNNILGVQGPKATTFWLEDPEEVLREAARLRRAKAPAKRKKDSGHAVEHTTIAPVRSNTDACAAGYSSPLSSAPSSPESMHEPETPEKATRDIIQLDGARDRKPAKHSTRTPSPTKKLIATTTPRLPPNTPFTPQTLTFPSSKKRKAMARYLPKTPRSPDRHRTVGNPPLNQGCVIAFAESEGKEGVLRQVKGERQGVFTEEYVVLATRFFVPGG